MIGIPVNANSVYIPVVQTGCLKVEFDSTYPVHLNGIISQDEFRESINRINRTISSNKILIVLGVIFALFTIGGIICFIAGGVTASRNHTFGFPALIGVGIGLSLFGSLLFSLGCCSIQFRRLARMREAVAAESMKYSSRSPTPCSWRLDTSRNYVGGYGNHYHHHHQVAYYIVIDIGRSVGSGSGVYYSNPTITESNVYYGQQDNYAPPPPYPNQSNASCPQCHAPRQDPSAKFCSICGNSFNKY